MPEQEIVLHDKIIQYFAKWFDVYYEVKSDCGSCRIDILMFHNSDFKKEHAIGIEIKRMDELKRGSELAKWCIQAQRYTKTTFNGKKASIFVAPQISHFYLQEGEKICGHDVFSQGYTGAHYNVNSFLYGSFGIGELQKYKGYHKTVWYMRLTINTYIAWDSQFPLAINNERLI